MFDYFVYLLVLVCIYTILTASLDLMTGYAGIFSFAHAAFAGIGAYAAAILATKLRLEFIPTILVAVAICSIIALVVGIPTLRLSGHYFVLGSFGLAAITASVIINWSDLTNGPLGIYGIPRARIFGLTIGPGLPFLSLCVALTALVLFAKWRLVSAPFGIALRGMRDDETVAAVLGNNVAGLRLAAFVMGSGATAIAGTLLAYNLNLVSPAMFGDAFYIFILTAVFVGGSGSLAGNIAGPALLVLFPEALRFVGIGGTNVGHIQQAFYGALLLVLMVFRSQGVLGRFQVRSMGM